MSSHATLLLMLFQASGEWSYSAPRQGSLYPASIRSVLETRDVDGDGVNEVLIGRADLASLSNMTGHWEGRGTVLCISGANREVLWRNDGPTNFDCPNDFGSVLESVGDVDGDAISDVAIGAPYIPDGMDGFTWNPSAVRSTVRIVSGKDGRLIREHEGIKGSVDGFGVSVTATGDLDGDGEPDYAVGSSTVGFYGPHLPASSDSVSLYSARSGALIGKLEGTRFDAGESFGRKLLDAGDLDGDGVHELAVQIDTGLEFGGTWSVISGKERQNSFVIDKRLGRIGSDMVALGDRTDDGVGDFAVLVVEDVKEGRRLFVALISGKDGALAKRVDLGVPADSLLLQDHALQRATWRPVLTRNRSGGMPTISICSWDPSLWFSVDEQWQAHAMRAPWEAPGSFFIMRAHGGSSTFAAFESNYFCVPDEEGAATIVRRVGF